jgi:hypothetical protein
VNKLKFWIGVSMLILSCLIPLLGFWVATLSLPVAIKGAIIAALTFGGPEIMALLAVALLGKEAFHAITSKIFPLLMRLAPQGSVSKTRYTVGLFMFVISFIPSYVSAYDPSLLPNRFFVCVAADVVFLLSLFVLGGDFWDKLRALFIYDARADFSA